MVVNKATTNPKQIDSCRFVVDFLNNNVVQQIESVVQQIHNNKSK